MTALLGSGVPASWDSGFGRGELYGQADLDLVLHIKELVYGEGLTLAGARRRLEEEAGDRHEGAAPSAPLVLFDEAARERLRAGAAGATEILDCWAAAPPQLQLVSRAGSGEASGRHAPPAEAEDPGVERGRFLSGCSAAWLARLLGVQEVPGSNPGIPTTFQRWPRGMTLRGFSVCARMNKNGIVAVVVVITAVVLVGLWVMRSGQRGRAGDSSTARRRRRRRLGSPPRRKAMSSAACGPRRAARTRRPPT